MHTCAAHCGQALLHSAPKQCVDSQQPCIRWSTGSVPLHGSASTLTYDMCRQEIHHAHGPQIHNSFPDPGHARQRSRGGRRRTGKGARSGKNDAKAAVAGYNTKTDANKDKDVGTRQDTSHETTSIRDHISSPTLHVAARRSRQENRHLKSLDLHRDQRQFLTPRPAPLEPTIPPLDLQYHTSDLKLSKHQKPRTVRQHNPGT